MFMLSNYRAWANATLSTTYWETQFDIANLEHRSTIHIQLQYHSLISNGGTWCTLEAKKILGKFAN